MIALLLSIPVPLFIPSPPVFLPYFIFAVPMLECVCANTRALVSFL